MSYQQTANHSEGTFNRAAPAMYTQPQARSTRDSQGQSASYAQGTMAGSQNENLAMNAMMNQFAGLALPGTGMPSAAALGAAQLAMGGNQYYWNPADQSFLVAPAAMYPTQTVAPAQHAENAYTPFASMPYFPQGAYPSYIPGYPLMPYTPNRGAGYYPDRSDQLHKEVVPGLENRRGSYSTTESVPGTPYYGSVSQREQVTKIAAVDRSPFGSTPSPQQLPVHHADQQKPLPYNNHSPGIIDLDALLVQHPAIPRAVPAVFTPRESLRTLEQSLANPIIGNRNVYIRGLHPQTDDETLKAYAARFGNIETSKAIIDTSTGACKGFGFAKYHNVRDSELCIRAFFKLGYEVGFARESFNSRLKAEGDDNSTNLYVSNLPKEYNEPELEAIFEGYKVQSSRILRNHQNLSRGVGFARFESRELCEEIIKIFHGRAVGDEGLLLQVRYADTPAQKDLKRITTERRQFRTNEYNVGAYGPDALSLSPSISAGTLSPLGPRTAMVARHFASGRSNGSWKRENSGSSFGGSIGGFKELEQRHQVKVSLTEPSPHKVNKERVSGTTPSVSEDGSAEDGVTIHNESPAVAHSGSVSPTARKS